MSAAIAVEGLERAFDEVLAVQGIDLEVGEGEIYGFLGPNGAGKTTTVRMLTTLLLPTGGRATVAGHDVVSAARSVRASIGVALQEAALDPLMTGRELIRLQATLHGLSRQEGNLKAEALLELYLSGEMGDIMHEAAKKGLVGQTALHSPTSRYGTVSRLDRFKTPELRRIMEEALVGIQNGQFAQEWAADQEHGYPRFKAYQNQLSESPFGQVEREVLAEVSQAQGPSPALAAAG